ncbi:MAG: GTP-binding protein [Rubrobacter sp.]|nr:GTP-binding protein [Rubrobacter sp.]
MGSGKTTLLSRLLAEPDMKNTAVLVNEIGEVGLDHHLLERVDETTVLLDNGCLCCTRREDLAQTLRDLLERESRGIIPPINRVAVETSGLADPSPIPFTILSDPVLRHHYEPGTVISTLDAVNARLHLRDNPESVRQISASDAIVVTKTDLAHSGATDSLLQTVESINPHARILANDSPQTTSALLHRPSPESAASPPDPPTSLSPAAHDPENGVRPVSVAFDEPLDWSAFGVWLSALLYARGEDVLRVKGLLDTSEAGPTSINGVQHVIHPPDHLDRWPQDQRNSRLTFITRNIDHDLLLRSLRAFQPEPRKIS